MVSASSTWGGLEGAPGNSWSLASGPDWAGMELGTQQGFVLVSTFLMLLGSWDTSVS